MRRGDYRNYYKGHMDKIKGEGRGGGGRVGWLGWGGGWGEKHRSVMNNNKKIKKKYSAIQTATPNVPVIVVEQNSPE